MFVIGFQKVANKNVGPANWYQMDPQGTFPMPVEKHKHKGHAKHAASVRGAYVGAKAGLKSFPSPRRVTPYVRPGNPVQGLESLTGVAAREVFGNPISKFTNVPRKALHGMSRVRGSR